MYDAAVAHAWIALPKALAWVAKRNLEREDMLRSWLAVIFCVESPKPQSHIALAMQYAARFAARKAIRGDSYSGECCTPRRTRKDIIAESVELTLQCDRADHRHDGDFGIDLGRTLFPGKPYAVSLDIRSQAIGTLLSQGYSQKDIAKALHISNATVSRSVDLIAGFIALQRG